MSGTGSREWHRWFHRFPEKGPKAHQALLLIKPRRLVSMSSASISSAVLSALEAQPPGKALHVQDVVAAVTDRLDDRDDPPTPSAIRGRLTTLRQEGVVERPERGRYALVRADPTETPALTRLVDVVEDIFRPEALRRTVLWDATPYLQRTEDGGPGARLVVEQKRAGSYRDEVEVNWPGDEQVFTWTVKTKGPLGLALWEPDDPSPYRIPTGIVFVERERFGATGLTPRGYRAPFPERVVVEFLGFEGPASAAPIVRQILRDPSTRFPRLWQAAESLGATADLAALLAGTRESLPEGLREEFLERLPAVVRTLVEDRRR